MHRPLIWVPQGMSDLIDRAPQGFELTETPDDVANSDRLNDVEIVILGYGPPTFAASFSKMTNLKLLQTTTAGVDGVLPHVPKGVSLCSSRGSYGVVAEWVVGAILADYKEFPLARDAQNEGRWARPPVRRLAGSTVLFVGHGSIAEHTEAILRPIGVEFLRVARTARDGISTLAELPELLPRADVVVLLVPLTNDTKGLVDQEFFNRMKEGALLVNAARGAVVNTDALIASATSGHVHAVLDVTDPEPLPLHHPLFSTPNVFITGHIAGGGLAWIEVNKFIVEQLERYEKGEPLENVVTVGY